MTPFDAIALLAMLLAFYPVASPANLQLARRERPEYFAGGTLIGSKGDKLELPDGRVFDLIFAAGDPSASHWQAIDVTATSTDDPFPLERGPFVPIDVHTFPFPRLTADYTGFVADQLRELGDAPAALDQAHQTIAETSSPAALEAAFAGHVEGGEAALSRHRRYLEEGDVSRIIDVSGRHGSIIDTNASQYDDAPPQAHPGPEIPEPPRPQPPRHV